MLYIVDLNDTERVDFRIAGGRAEYDGNEIPNLLFESFGSKVPHHGDNPDMELYVRTKTFVLQEDGGIVSRNDGSCADGMATLLISKDKLAIVGVPGLTHATLARYEGENLVGKNLSVFLGRSGKYCFTLVFSPKFTVLNEDGKHLVNAPFMRVMTL